MLKKQQKPKVKFSELGTYLRIVALDYPEAQEDELADIISEYFNVVCTTKDIENYRYLHYMSEKEENSFTLGEDFELESRKHMKNIILTIVIIVGISKGSISQIEIIDERDAVKFETVWQVHKLSHSPNLTRAISGVDTMYYYSYQNPKYTAITAIESLTTGTPSDTKTFFNLCLRVISSGKEISLNMYDNDVKIGLSNYKNSVVVYNGGSYFYLSDKLIMKILESIGV